MKLLVIVLCLFSERFLMHGISYQRFAWFPNYCQKIQKATEHQKIFDNPWLLILAIVLPIVLFAALVYCLLHTIIFGFVGLILSLIIFLYCLGPQNVFYPVIADNSKESSEAGSYFAAANSQLFSLIFWYVLCGPIVALAYRLIFLCQTFPTTADKACQLTNILEWVPARLTVVLYLLVGNFQRGLVSFLKFITSKPSLNKDMLSECGLKAVRSNDNEEVPMPIAESLVEHAAIVLLVLIALFTLAAFL